MNNAISAKEFHFNTSLVRTSCIDGAVWFCASDVCDALGYTNGRGAIRNVCRQKGVEKRYTLTKDGKQELTYISESNLYRLVIRSRKPEAQAFEEWVMEEVLPSIRKTGSYQRELPLSQKSRTEAALAYIQGQRFILEIKADGKMHCEPMGDNFFWELCKAIKDPANYGLSDGTIRMVGEACLDALVYRAGSRGEARGKARAELKKIGGAK